MVWWPFNKKIDDSDVTDQTKSANLTASSLPSNYSKGQRILLEDTNPRFNNETSQRQIAQSQEEASFKKAWDSIRWEDFSFAKLTMIPCFRDAGLVGFTSMFVVGAVTFLYHKNPARSANWSVGGLLLGSVVGWEQCRLKRKHSFQVAQLARDTMASKKKPMLNTVSHDERLSQQWEGHKNGQRLESETETKSKSWFKFW